MAHCKSIQSTFSADILWVFKNPSNSISSAFYMEIRNKPEAKHKIALLYHLNFIIIFIFILHPVPTQHRKRSIKKKENTFSAAFTNSLFRCIMVLNFILFQFYYFHLSLFKLGQNIFLI